jgi:hypothetical protein
LGDSVITQSGSFIGIGTASPVSRTDIAGASVDQLAWGVLSVRSSDAQGADKGGSLAFGGLYDATNSTHWAQISGRKENGTSGQYGGYLAFATRTNGAGANTERARIDSAGNVGIGTASPGAKLDIRGAARLEVADPRFDLVGTYRSFMTQVVDGANAAASYWRLYDITASANRIVCDASGNVGIGTASPGAILHTLGTGTTTGIFATTSANAWVELRRSTSTTLGYIGTGAGLVTGGAAADLAFRCESGNLLFSTGATERARIDSAGNLILNTATTGATIQAAGTNQGLKLPATPGNADTQTLDCYQENYASNSWTPVIFGGTTAGTATYSVQEGFYTRWGNLIFCTATVVFSGHTGTGNLSLSGLPFAAKTAGSGTYRSSIIIEEGGGVKAILRLQSGTTATTTGVSIAASGNYVITFVYATN